MTIEDTRNRQIILVGEATSAIQQCTAIFGNARTQRILHEINEAREEQGL